MEVLLGGGLLDEVTHFGDWNNYQYVTYNDRYAMIQVPDRTEGKYEFYFFLLEPLQPDESLLLFDEFHVPDEWSGADMQHLKYLEIKVEAFGVQVYELDNCIKAMTEAFPEHFDF